MDLIIVAALVLAGSILESAFAFLFGGKAPEENGQVDALTDARYSRLQSDFDTA